MINYTKGEWKTHHDNLGGFYIVNENRWIAKIYSMSGILECEGNAQLIASAPDLYEALKEAIRFYDAPLTQRESGDLVEFLQKALAKAEGNNV